MPRRYVLKTSVHAEIQPTSCVTASDIFGAILKPTRPFVIQVMTALEHGIPLVMVAVDSGTHRYAIGVESLQLRKELARTIDVHCLNFLAVH
eukprot:902931-Pleurochrysis_carterae.AAC.1